MSLIQCGWITYVKIIIYVCFVFTLQIENLGVVRLFLGKKIDLLLGKEALKLMKINSLPSLHCITLQHIGVFFYIQTEITIIFHILPFYLYL